MFKVEKVTNEIVDFIRDYYEKNNLKGAVIGISGGKDSAVVAGLFAKALGSENVVGIWMPCHSKEEDFEDAKMLTKHLGISLKEHDLTALYDDYLLQIKENNLVNDSELVDANINLKPRLRMSTLYYYAAMLSRMNKGIYIVAGTGNKCEIYVGYFTKGGDNISDINVLADLTVDEVIQIGEYLGLPEQVIHKAPNDGLSGQTDEEKLGVKYSDITEVINNPDKPQVSKEVYDKITNMHNQNSHKFKVATYRMD